MRIVATLALVLAAACSSGRSTGGGTGSTDAGTSGGDAGGQSGVACSSDLQNVVDSQGNVVTACPSDQGCLAGACIAACDAAAGSKGNVGCDFLASTPSFDTVLLPPCFAVFIANNWTKAVHIDVSQGTTSYDATTFGRVASSSDPDATNWPAIPSSGLAPGDVAVLFLSSDPDAQNAGTSLACPVAQAVAGSTAVTETGLGTAFAVHTDAPVSAYDILPYGGAKSYLPAAELLLPTSAWGTSYVAAVPPTNTASDAVSEHFAQIIASADGTTVQIRPTTTLPAGTGVPQASPVPSRASC